MYQVNFYKGDYGSRQKQANEDGCVAYVEHHFNSSTDPNAGYSVVVTGSNASQTSKNWGRWYASAVSREFNIKIGGDNGILVGGYNGRGDANLRYTEMPAILLEPLFASNPLHVNWLRGEEGQMRLASILSESIQRFFQKGGLIGFSVGHKYKASSPNDRGAAVVGGGFESDYAEAVLNKAKVMIEEANAPQADRDIKIIQNGKFVSTLAVDPDSDVTWDRTRGVLSIG